MEFRIAIEVCVESAAGALVAERAGADRVELCAGLVEGGTTPSAGAIAAARAATSLELVVLLRPRGGDFLYSKLELDTLRRDVEEARRLGADGVALGCLTAAGDVDVERTGALVELARPLRVTFHRAFDHCRDPLLALEQLRELGVERLLTSGQETRAADGTGLLRELVAAAGDRLEVVAAGGLRAPHVAELVAQTGVRAVHFAARATRPSPREHVNPRCPLSAREVPAEGQLGVTDSEQVRALVRALRGG